MNSLLGVSALLAMIPAALQALRSSPSRDRIFWGLLMLAVAGPSLWGIAQVVEAWQTSLAAALWITIAATMVLYAITALMTDHAWRLAPLVASYMIVLGIIATVWQHAPGQPMVAGAGQGAWVAAHIITSVTTYALVTIAAVAALAAFLKERALKNKRPTGLTKLLPSILDSEALMIRLLMLGEAVLALGLVSGMALQYEESGSIIPLNHKTLLTLAAFTVIGGLLAYHYRSGVRGKLATRIVLLAYLLLTLGYPGVKFVTDVLMA